MNVKHLKATLMAVIFLVSLTVGCTQSPADSVPGSDASPASTAAQTAGPSSTTVSQDEGTELEHVSLTMATIRTVEGWDYNEGDAYAKWLSDKFNYDIEMIHLTDDVWAERMRVWITSMDMPDVALYNLPSNLYPEAVSYVEQGLLKELPDDWKSKYPTLAELYETSELGPVLEEDLGGTYYIPRARFAEKPADPLVNHINLYMRKDWAQAVDFPIKDIYTTSEVIDYGKRIAEQDPGDIGSQVVGIAARPSNAVQLFVATNSSNYKKFYRDGDTYKWGPASEDTLLGLQKLQEAFKSGALDQEFYTLKDYDDWNKGRISGIAGSWYGEGSPHGIHEHWEAYFRVNVGLDPEQAGHNAIIVGEDGKYHDVQLENYWAAYIFNPKIDDVKLDRVLSIMDFMGSEEGYRTMCMGFEGVDWEYGPNGEYVSLLGEGETLITKVGRYPSGGHPLFAPYFSDQFNLYYNPIYLQRHREMAQKVYSLKEENSDSESVPLTDWGLFRFDSPNMRRVQFDYVAEYIQLVTMDGDLETNWRNWVAENAPLIDPVIEELNAALIND